MDISIKEIMCTTIDENGKLVRKDRLESSPEKLDEFIKNFFDGDIFVMESTNSLNRSTISKNQNG